MIRDGLSLASPERLHSATVCPAENAHSRLRAGIEDAKTAIRAAVQYLLKESSGGDRGVIAREIIEIVKEAVRGLQPGGQDPLDDGFPDPFDDAPGG